MSLPVWVHTRPGRDFPRIGLTHSDSCLHKVKEKKSYKLNFKTDLAVFKACNTAGKEENACQPGLGHHHASFLTHVFKCRLSNVPGYPKHLPIHVQPSRNCSVLHKGERPRADKNQKPKEKTDNLYLQTGQIHI